MAAYWTHIEDNEDDDWLLWRRCWYNYDDGACGDKVSDEKDGGDCDDDNGAIGDDVKVVIMTVMVVVVQYNTNNNFI